MVYAVKLEEDVTRRDRVRCEHKAGKMLLKYGLAKEFGIDLSMCEIKKNEHGKPYLKNYPDVFYNISHCKSMVVCVLGNTPVGIDIEAVRNHTDGLMKRVLTAEEYEHVYDCRKTGNMLEFFKYWTLKEAYGKAVGVGMLYDYADMTFRISGGNIICPDDEYRMWQRVINDELVLTVCRKQNESFEENIEYVAIDYNELEEKNDTYKEIS